MPKPPSARVDHRLAVRDQTERLANQGIVERGLVDGHQDHLDGGARRVDHLDLAGLLLRVRLRELELAHHVDLTGEQSVEPGRVVGDGDVLPLVDVRLALVPVVRVLVTEAPLADREGHEHERPGTDRIGVVRVPVLNHYGVLLYELVVEARIGALEGNGQGDVVDLLHLAEPDVDDARVGDVRGSPMRPSV